jgi:hypothetical protein
MTQTVIQKIFEPFKQYLPTPISNLIRSFFTAMLTPILFSYRTGHFRSSWKMLSVSRIGEPVPWYTYPCIDFLRHRDFSGKTVLEFGGGQSSLWWSQRAKSVVTLEGNHLWHEKIKTQMPSNVHLFLVSVENSSACVESVNKILQAYVEFDVIIIDGLFRSEMIAISQALTAKGGAIICDNAEGYGFYEGFRESGMSRVDFFGNAPGVVLPHCTSLFFKEQCFLLSSEYAIPSIAKADL